jgi:hypothetical protein
VLKKQGTSLQDHEEDRLVRAPVMLQRIVIYILAALLLLTWISGCAFWSLHRKGTRLTESSRSTRTASKSLSQRQDRSSLPRSALEKKSTGKAAPGSSPPALSKPRTTGSGSKQVNAQTQAKQSSADGEYHEVKPSFQKHDHAKYVSSIKNKAIDLLNKHENATQAILCNNRTTDQWSLTLYFKRTRICSYTAYAWDDVDQNWKKVFSADRLPISKWREHMRYSSQDKQCSMLKGANLHQ